MTSSAHIIRGVCALALLIGTPLAAAAGQRQEMPTVADPNGTSATLTTTSGWLVTPSLLLSRTSDDNVLMHGPGDTQDHDLINVINPRADLNYNGRLTQFASNYTGAFVRYNSLTSLDSYEQHAGATMKRRVTKFTSFYFNADFTASPTTELLNLPVPYVRTGATTDNFHGGIERTGKRVTLDIGAHFQQARFEANQTYENLLLGGNSIGADLSIRRRMTETTSLFADANTEHETIGQAQQQFDVQRVVAGAEHRLSERTLVFAGAGVSRLSATQFGPARSGPSFKLGISQHYHATIIDVSYDRAFVPSFGFGGTTQNGSLTVRAQTPITRRIYTQDLVSYQRQDAIIIDFPSLRSVWMQAAVGYIASPWLRIEAYYAGTRQTVIGPDALLHHNQFGVQVITGKPVRIH
ncbi:MAG TPA: hypothetical protein VN628_08340 [Vicinamibacterales bacterium]|nr:hypothetical protein [Vicinamibacterales bacterium]